MIQYDAVYSKTAELRSRLETELEQMEATYRQADPIMQDMDGKTNAAFKEAMAKNQRKAKVATETLHKLLAFMELSARQVQHNELRLKSKFTKGMNITGGADRNNNGTGSASTATSFMNTDRTPIQSEGGGA